MATATGTTTTPLQASGSRRVVATPTTIETGPPRALFDTGIRGGFLDRRNQYLVTKDGQRFLVNRSAEDENSAPITVVMNWEAARRN